MKPFYLRIELRNSHTYHYTPDVVAASAEQESEESQPSRIGDFIVTRQLPQSIASGSAKDAATMLGKLGGASKSAAKQRASKKNGRKGGRPKKTK